MIEKLTCELPPWTGAPWLSILCDILVKNHDRSRVLKMSLCTFTLGLKRASFSPIDRSIEDQIRRLKWLVRLLSAPNRRIHFWKVRTPQPWSYGSDTRADKVAHTQTVGGVSVYILGEPRVLHSVVEREPTNRFTFDDCESTSRTDVLALILLLSLQTIFYAFSLPPSLGRSWGMCLG